MFKLLIIIFLFIISVENQNNFLEINKKNKEYRNNKSLLDVFENLKLKKRIREYPIFNAFQELVGYGSMIDTVYSTTKNYLIDLSKNRVVEFDEKWHFKKHTFFNVPLHVVPVNQSIYVIGVKDIFKTDIYFNTIKRFQTYEDFLGAYYNSTSMTFLISAYAYKIYEFDLDLNIIDSIDTKDVHISSLQGYNNKLYAGDCTGNMHVIENKEIYLKYQICNSRNSRIQSILFDQQGYMALTCDYDGAAMLFYTNGTFTGMSITNLKQPSDMGFDSKGNFILLGATEARIYN